MTAKATAPEPPKRGRGRPPVGPRIHIHIPTNVLADIDRAAAERGVTRADEIRARLTR